MIFDHIDNHLDCQAAHPGFKIAFDFLKAFDSSTPDGRYPLDGDRVIAHVQSYNTSAPNCLRFESHREYLDLHYVASGRETIYHSSLDRLTPTDAYDAEKDSIHYSGKEIQALQMWPGYFAVLYPQDGHKARCVLQEEGFVKKVVLKIRADH